MTVCRSCDSQHYLKCQGHAQLKIVDLSKLVEYLPEYNKSTYPEWFGMQEKRKCIFSCFYRTLWWAGRVDYWECSCPCSSLCNYSCDPSTFQKRAKSQNLLDKVFDHLELIEKDYFGLQFLDLSPDPESMVRDKMVSSPSKTKVTFFFSEWSYMSRIYRSQSWR